MRVIITGGTGTIGSELASSLVADGHEVIGLSRHPTRHSAEAPEGVRLVEWDARTSEGWGHLADGADVIVNLAGENIGAGRWTEARKRAILQSRKNAGEAVVQAIAGAAKKPRLVLQPSGVDYYGVHSEEKITEDHLAGDTFLSLVCKDWEDATKGVEQYGVRRVVYRGGVVLTMKGGAFPRLVLPFRFFVGGRLGSGKQWFSWIHIQDQIAAMRWFMENPQASGVYNLCAPTPVQNRELARTIGRAMGRPTLFPVPAFVIHMIFGEMAVTVLGGQRVIPQRLESEGFKFKYPEPEQAIRDLVG